MSRRWTYLSSNELRTSQSWHATESSPDADIYVARMDHFGIAARFTSQP